MGKYANLVSRLTQQQQDKLANYLELLPARHKAVALAALKGKKQKELASLFHVSQSAISQMLKKTFQAIAEIEKESK